VTVEVRRSADRPATRADGLVSRHSFSFGTHYDPADVGLGVLVAHNDDTVERGLGYATHPHRDLEIVTWVLAGGLRHGDTDGLSTGADLVVPGRVQRLSAGSGVRHSEHHDPSAGPAVRFVQMWVLPDEPGGDPSYVQADVEGALADGGLVPVASGRTDAAVPIRNRDATLHVARLGGGTSVLLPDAPYLHLFVARGRADVEGAGALGEADAARFVADGQARVTAGDQGAEVVAWEMHRGRP
jgi:redox-sensitive bicupin YhaK (pirin superfamily)